MIIISLTDLHGHAEMLPSISGDLSCADAVLVTGDITHFGGSPEAARIIKEIRKYNNNILAVPGNCDYPEAGNYLAQENINLDGKAVVMSNTVFMGIGGSLPCPGKTPNEFTEDEFKVILDKASSEIPRDLPLILVSHQPPRGAVADRTGNGANVGSSSIRKFIEEARPLICFCGHIHEGRGMETIGETQVINPGPLSEGKYAWARINAQIEKIGIRG